MIKLIKFIIRVQKFEKETYLEKAEIFAKRMEQCFEEMRERK
jgi:hypothetical protein